MKNMKIIVVIGAVVIVVLAVLLFMMEPVSAPAPEQAATDETTPINDMDTGRMANPEENPSPETPAPIGKLKVGNFTGKLEEVNTGCFADGECYVVVDGKHITTTMGWSRETVGTIQGAPSIGDMESMIGANVEVYAKDNGDGTYSLYGSEGFYVKVLPKNWRGGTPSTKSCVVGGCSGEMCTDAKSEPMVSTCIYRPQYACYKTAACEQQSTGECGWTETPELMACIANTNADTNLPQ